MKLTKATMAILKNFSVINTGILFREGNEITTMAVAENVLAKATVEESFPIEFALYDLNEFLATMSLFDEPELVFNEDYLVAKSGGAKVKYFYTDSRNIITPDPGEVFPSCDTSIFISSEQLAALQKSAAIMKLGDLRITIEDGTATVMVCDKSKSTDNEYAIQLDGEVDCDDIILELKMETLTLLPLDYEVGLNSDFIEFRNAAKNVVYWVAVDE